MLSSLIVSAQIDYRYNKPRAGDRIIKQQVEYKDPGRNGENVIWDFGKLKFINDEYSLVYSQPHLIGESMYIIGENTLLEKKINPNDLLIGTEHNTMYYYQVNDNRLWLLGHENPTTLLQYTKPILWSVYPTNYTDSYKDGYQSEGLYSSRIPFSTNGDIEIQADAYGMMTLPGGDTLNHVLRVKTVQTINEVISKKSGEETRLNTTVESYKWYAKGYRYPVFETVRTYKDGSQENSFETAFLFPPQDHFYLDNDESNLAVLDSLWKIEHKVKKDVTTPDEPQQANLTYNYYPNPVNTHLTIEYYLEQTTPVTICLYSLEGRLMKTVIKQAQSKGLYSEQLDCSSFFQGTYILKILTNNSNITEKIIKK